MAAPANLRVSATEYLEAERLSEFKSEFLNGGVIPRTGPAAEEWIYQREVFPHHSTIACNLTVFLGQEAKRRGFRLFGSDLKVGIEGSAYFYPDISIVCGPMELITAKKDVLANPSVIVEILSPSTEAYDRGVKFHAYREIASLQHYVLVSQASKTVDIFSRQEPLWTVETVSGDGEMRLSSLDVAVPLSAIYDQVSFEQ